MTKPHLENASLASGTWTADLVYPEDREPDLTITLRGAMLDGLTVRRSDYAGKWSVEFALSPEHLNDGVQSFVLSDKGVPLGSFTLLAGDPLGQDVLAEVDMLRAELEVLKQAFRKANR